MINIFFDCEFTKLRQPNDPVPAELISIGCISEDNHKFYAESSCYKVENCSQFVLEAVLPLLEGGDYLMPRSMITKMLKAYIESFDGEVVMWSDAPYYDWRFVKKMFDDYEWPTNLRQRPGELFFPIIKQQHKFEVAVEDSFCSTKLLLRRHHALDDAIANRSGFLAVKGLKSNA